MIVAIIPARGGSKRIPYKNIRPFAGKPIIAYSIEAAQECRLFERIIDESRRLERVTIEGEAESNQAEEPTVRPERRAGARGANKTFRRKAR